MPLTFFSPDAGAISTSAEFLLLIISHFKQHMFDSRTPEDEFRIHITEFQDLGLLAVITHDKTVGTH